MVFPAPAALKFSSRMPQMLIPAVASLRAQGNNLQPGKDGPAERR